MLARDIMTRTILSVTPDHSIRHAAQIMLDHHVSGLPVIDDAGGLVGMLTEGDLLRRVELGPRRSRATRARPPRTMSGPTVGASATR